MSLTFRCFRRGTGVFTSTFAAVVSDTGASTGAFSRSTASRVGDSVKYGEAGGDGDAGSEGF